MRPSSRVAAFLAVLVLAYTGAATFLECGMHGAVPAAAGVAQGHHHHDRGDSSDHAHHGGPIPRRDDRGGPCCHSTLYNAVFQSLSTLQLVRAEALLPVPAGFAALPSADVVPATTAGRHWATGPPLLSGPNGPLFSARPRYLAVSSFLV